MGSSSLSAAWALKCACWARFFPSLSYVIGSLLILSGRGISLPNKYGQINNGTGSDGKRPMVAILLTVWSDAGNFYSVEGNGFRAALTPYFAKVLLNES